MSADEVHFDRQVRAFVYDTIFTQGVIPTVAASAAGLARSLEEVVAAFQRLAQSHVFVLQQGGDEILMANPFSAVPTPFQVQSGSRTYWGNCIWDALGILTMLHSDGQVLASCGDCNAALAVTVHDGTVVDSVGVGHFSVPAKQWWNNIVFT
jgi:hypothetical protein